MTGEEAHKIRKKILELEGVNEVLTSIDIVKQKLLTTCMLSIVDGLVALMEGVRVGLVVPSSEIKALFAFHV